VTAAFFTSRRRICLAGSASFRSLLKKELVYQEKFRTREEAKRKLFEYIEIFYNRQRLHSVIGYRTPVEYEHTFAKLASFFSI